MADPNTPSWLQEENNTPASPGAVADTLASDTNDGVGGRSVTAAGASALASSAEDDAELQGIIMTMRLANMGASVALLVASILEMITIPNIGGFVLAIYASLGAILICCLESQLKFLRVMIAVNFGFLFHSVWRFLFYCLLGSVAFTFERGLIGKIVGGCLIGVALFNMYVLCRYPAYQKIRKQLALEEDKRIEARISKEVKRRAAQQIVG